MNYISTKLLRKNEIFKGPNYISTKLSENQVIFLGNKQPVDKSEGNSSHRLSGEDFVIEVHDKNF